MPTLNNIPLSTQRKVFLGGAPKSAGKTTFSLYAPGKKLVLLYDLGNAPTPPGVDPSQIWIRQYEASISVLNDKSDKWMPPSNVGSRIIKDIETIRNAYTTDQPMITFQDGEEIPKPDTIILDGMTELPKIMIDWILSVNKKTSAEDFIGDNGKVNRYMLWQKRLTIMRSLLNMMIQLPATVILVGWETAEMKDGESTGRIIPDIGGQLDTMVPGKVDASLRLYSRMTQQGQHYYAQCQPDVTCQWIGVRGRYDLPREIDITVGPNAPKPKTTEELHRNPWERVFGTR